MLKSKCKIGIYITARLGSTRLKQKHLLVVDDKPIINCLVKRIDREFRKEIENGAVEIVITTSDEEENRLFEQLEIQHLRVFYGCKNNIPYRHLQTAESLGHDLILSIDGDDILCSPKAMRQCFNALHTGEQYVKTSGLPLGMNAAGYSRCFLSASVKDKSSEILETGWGRIFNEKDLFEIQFTPFEEDANLRFTLDYVEDYHFFKAAIEGIGKKMDTIDDSEIVQYVLKNDIHQLNATLIKGYWENFNQEQKKDINSSKDQETAGEKNEQRN